MLRPREGRRLRTRRHGITGSRLPRQLERLEERAMLAVYDGSLFVPVIITSESSDFRPGNDIPFLAFWPSEPASSVKWQVFEDSDGDNQLSDEEMETPLAELTLTPDAMPAAGAFALETIDWGDDFTEIWSTAVYRPTSAGSYFMLVTVDFGSPPPIEPETPPSDESETPTPDDPETPPSDESETSTTEESITPSGIWYGLAGFTVNLSVDDQLGVEIGVAITAGSEEFLEGSPVDLAAVLSFPPDVDPEQVLAFATYTWTVDYDSDGDGSFETPIATQAGEQPGDIRFLPLNDGSYRLTVRVETGSTISASASRIIDVENVAPVITSLTGSALSAVPGQEVTFSASSFDPADALDTSWEVLDASGQVVANGSGETLSFTPSDIGLFTIRFTASDDHTTASESLTLSVVGAVLRGSELVVGTSATGSTVSISGKSTLTVEVDGLLQTFSGPISRIIVHGQDGDDTIEISGGLTVPVWVFAGGGNDFVKGGGTGDVLVGGDGDDVLIGGSGRDLLIGGRGSDVIIGNAGDDILIAGWTDLTEEELTQVMNGWLSSDSFAMRVAQLSALINSDNVFDDHVTDYLTGAGGTDWYFANLALNEGDSSLTLDQARGMVRAEFEHYIELVDEDVLEPVL